MNDRGNQHRNGGSTRKNPKKREGHLDPDMSGQCIILCPACAKKTTYWMNGWINGMTRGIENSYVAWRFLQVRDKSPIQVRREDVVARREEVEGEDSGGDKLHEVTNG